MNPLGEFSPGDQRKSRCLVVQLGDKGVRVKDTRKVMSMRGTMSNDVVLVEVYLPEEQAPIYNRPVSGEPRDASVPAAFQGASLGSGKAFTGSIMLGLLKLPLIRP